MSALPFRTARRTYAGIGTGAAAEKRPKIDKAKLVGPGRSSRTDSRCRRTVSTENRNRERR